MVRRRKGKKIFVGIVATLVAMTAGGAIVKIVDNAKDDTKTLKSYNYAIGAIEEDGDFTKELKTSLVSDFVKVDGLVIDIQDENATVTYKVHYYGEDEKFIESTDSLTADYEQGELSEDIKFARVEITPNEDDEITLLEKGGYVNQVAVTVNK